MRIDILVSDEGWQHLDYTSSDGLLQRETSTKLRKILRRSSDCILRAVIGVYNFITTWSKSADRATTLTTNITRQSLTLKIRHVFI